MAELLVFSISAESGCWEQTAAYNHSSSDTYQMTSGGLGAPSLGCTLFFCGTCWISGVAWEEMKQKKMPSQEYMREESAQKHATVSVPDTQRPLLALSGNYSLEKHVHQLMGSLYCTLPPNKNCRYKRETARFSHEVMRTSIIRNGGVSGVAVSS